MFKDNIIESTHPISKELITKVLYRTLISTLKFNSKTNHNFEINFSIIFDTKYLKKMNELTSSSSDYLSKKRKYLIYFNLNDTCSSISKKTISTLMSNRNDIDINCIECKKVEERINRLSRAKFTLIIGDDSSEYWNHKRNIQMIEAIKCSTIPVFVGVSMQLPLSKFIAWNEIIVRVPIAKLAYLNQILSEIDESELITRQIKASNLYKSYFSSSTSLFRTLFAAIQYSLHLPISGLSDHIGQELIFQGN